MHIEPEKTKPLNDIFGETQWLKLSDLVLMIKNKVKESFPNSYFVIAEIQEFRYNSKNDVYNLTFVEKGDGETDIKAIAKGIIWPENKNRTIEKFKLETGINLNKGITILFKAKINFYEKQGNIFLNVQEIYPEYTLGDIERKKKETISKLQQEGLFDLNKKLEFPLIPIRIAVISSYDAAGYEDFKNILYHSGYKFEIKVFDAYVQGDNTVKTVVEKFNQINESTNKFDIVVLVRGGGSSVDLQYFNNYEICKAIATCKFPVLVGIGHTRDETIADMVAYKSFNTPSQVANFLVSILTQFEDEITKTEEKLKILARKIIEHSKNDITNKTEQIKYILSLIISQEKTKIENLANKLPLVVKNYIAGEFSKIQNSKIKIKHLCSKIIDNHRQQIEINKRAINIHINRLIERESQSIHNLEKLIYSYDPANILKRGYTITRLNGKIVKSTNEIKESDIIETEFFNGKIRSIVKNKI